MYIDWDRVRVEVHEAGRVRCGPEWHIGPEWAPRLRDFDLCYVWAGRGTIRLRGGEVRLRAGHCFWMRPGGVYLMEQDRADRLGITYIHFDLLTPEGATLSRGSADELPPETHDVEDPRASVAIADLAAEVGLSPDHFTRVFKQVLGMSPQAFRIQARITRARQLLSHSSLSVGQVAEAVGYEDLYFFSRQFKQQTGVSPRHWRGNR